jgi:hypothetical protein
MIAMIASQVLRHGSGLGKYQDGCFDNESFETLLLERFGEGRVLGTSKRFTHKIIDRRGESGDRS